MNRVATSLILCALFASLIITANAHGAYVKGKPYVVLVGIDKCKDKQILHRKNAEADAKALYDLYDGKERLEVADDNIKLLLGSKDEKRKSQPATRANILKALKWVSKNAGKNDLVVFGLFGQGAAIGDSSCYFATDSTYKNRVKDAVAAAEIEAAFKKLKSHRVVIFLDVNFAGFDPGKEKRPDPNLRSFYRAFLGNDEANKGFSRVLFVANGGLTSSLRMGNHSIFAKSLIAGLDGKADQFGYEPDGLITIGELTKYVRDEVPPLIRKHGKSDDEIKKQMPIVLEGQSHDFVVELNPPAHKKTQQRLTHFKKLAKDNKLDKKVVEEGEDLLSQMPKLEAKQEMRKIYQRLADGETKVAAFRVEREKVLKNMKLNERELLRYARYVLQASHRVLDEYFKKVDRGQMVTWAIEGLYQRVGEKIPSDIKGRLKKAKSLPDAKMLRLLVDARRHLGRREDLGKGKDVTFSLHRMLTKLDRHTDYYDPDTVRKLQVDTQGHFFGIGVQIRRNNTRDALEVVTPLIGSPAYKAGMQQGDFIKTIVREVDGKTGKPLPKPEIISTKGMSTEDAVKKILGKEGTKVKLIVERDGKSKEFELIRGKVELETVMGHKRNGDDSWNYVIDPENKICYVRLSQFSRNTFRDLSAVMKKLSKVGIKGFILDLRFNPGGLLDSAVKISDLYIDEGVIVTIKPRNGSMTSYFGRSDGSYVAFPMVCLVNGYSASGSEIVAACLQEHERAIIIGSRSYGKGSVQTIHPFDTDDGPGLLKLTTATFWSPTDQNLNKASTKGRPEDPWGVKPNSGFKLKLSLKDFNRLQEYMRYNEIIHRPGVPRKGKDIEKFQDTQLELALRYLRGQMDTSKKVAQKKQDAAVKQ